MPQLMLPIFPDGCTHITPTITFTKKDGRVTYFNALLSGYKSNKSNWLPESPVSNWDTFSERACKMGIFSKIETLRNCRRRSQKTF